MSSNLNDVNVNMQDVAIMKSAASALWPCVLVGIVKALERVEEIVIPPGCYGDPPGCLQQHCDGGE